MTRRLHIVVVSGSHERLQMAAMFASVAAVSGDEVRVFVSMNALPLFRKDASSAAPAEGAVGELLASRNVPRERGLTSTVVIVTP